MGERHSVILRGIAGDFDEMGHLFGGKPIGLARSRGIL